jgi:hypothetical protein
MHIITPADIEEVAWEGELEAPAVTMAPSRGPRPVVTIGKPAIWPAYQALENEVGQKWTAPLGGADFWLVRLACTLRQPPGLVIGEAQQMLYLRPKRGGAGAQAAYAYSLYPNRLEAEKSREYDVSLGPELKFADGSGFSLGQVGAKIAYRQVFPVIQGYGAGEPTPYWIFKPHPSRPLEGSQFVYAVLAAEAGAGGIRAGIELVVTVEMPYGLARLGLSEQAKAASRFDIP